MILGTITPRTIGQRYVGVRDGEGRLHNVPCLMLAEATREEYIAWCRENGVPEERITHTLTRDGGVRYFYRVSVD